MDRNQKIRQLRECIPSWPNSKEQCQIVEEQFEFIKFKFLLPDPAGKCAPSHCEFRTPDPAGAMFESFSKFEVFPEHATLLPSQHDKWNNCPSSIVTEKDFRLPEFRDANPEDYEFDKGRPVRKDRFVKGFEHLYDLLGLTGNLRDIETVCVHVVDLVGTEKLHSEINQLVSPGINQNLLSEVQNLVTLRNVILRNEVVSAEVMERYLFLSNTSLLNGWRLEDFAKRKWTIIQMVTAGHAFFKTGSGVPAMHYPITPPVRQVPEPAPKGFI